MAVKDHDANVPNSSSVSPMNSTPLSLQIFLLALQALGIDEIKSEDISTGTEAPDSVLSRSARPYSTFSLGPSFEPDDEESEPEALLASFLSSRFFSPFTLLGACALVFSAARDASCVNLLHGVAVATIVMIVDSNSESSCGW